MQLISKFNKGISCSLCAISIFSKDAQVISVKDKKGATITNAFQKMLDESNHKPNKIWVDKDIELHNRSIKLMIMLEYQNIKLFCKRFNSKLV